MAENRALEQAADAASNQSGVNLLGNTQIAGGLSRAARQAQDQQSYRDNWTGGVMSTDATAGPGATQAALEGAARSAVGAGEPDAFVDAWNEPTSEMREAMLVSGAPAPAPQGDGTFEVKGGPAPAPASPMGADGIVVKGGPMPVDMQGSASDRAQSYEMAWNDTDPQTRAAAERMAATANGGPGGLAIAARDGALNGPGSMSGAMDQASAGQGGPVSSGTQSAALGLADRVRQFPGGSRSNGPTA